MGCAVYYAICVYVYVCVFERGSERECVGQTRQGKREEGIDKQSESKGVAQSDKVNLMNEPSSKK